MQSLLKVPIKRLLTPVFIILFKVTTYFGSRLLGHTAYRVVPCSMKHPVDVKLWYPPLALNIDFDYSPVELSLF